MMDDGRWTVDDGQCIAVRSFANGLGGLLTGLTTNCTPSLLCILPPQAKSLESKQQSHGGTMLTK